MAEFKERAENTGGLERTDKLEITGLEDHSDLEARLEEMEPCLSEHGVQRVEVTRYRNIAESLSGTGLARVELEVSPPIEPLRGESFISDIRPLAEDNNIEEPVGESIRFLKENFCTDDKPVP